MTKNATERQKQFLVFACARFKETGNFPSLKEFAHEFGTSLRGVTGNLDALEKKGYLVKLHGVKRGYKICKLPNGNKVVPWLLEVE